MTAKKLSADKLGLPRFPASARREAVTFDLTSHRRAREALELALSIPEPGFNVFVLGEDRSGRLTSTVEFLKEAVASHQKPDDWVYVNNFNRLGEPISIRLPAGIGRQLRTSMGRLVSTLTEALRTAFGGEVFQKRMQSESEAAQSQLTAEMHEIQEAAKGFGLSIIQTEQGSAIVAIDAKGEVVPADKMNEAQRQLVSEHGPELAQKIHAINRKTAEMRAAFSKRAGELGRQFANQTCGPLIDILIGEFSKHEELNPWLVDLRKDTIENFQAFLANPNESAQSPQNDPERRYAINLLVDNQDTENAPVIVEANPTYENLFGRIEYRQSARLMETDFSLIRAGAFHRANGGIIILRADAIGSNPSIWPFIKGALRDGELRIDEPYRKNGPAISGALSPQPVPLDLKVVLIGAHSWYYTFFSADPEFQSYFKIKADIDPDVDATPENLETYSSLIRQMAQSEGAGKAICTDSAVIRLLAEASRWTADRTKLSSQCERVQDLLAEARRVADSAGAAEITAETVSRAIENRHRRNARIEDRIQEGIAEKSVLIATTGSVVGQVNALTVRDIGDHVFGTPSRVTARSSVGRRGVLNIERDVGLGGPIQQKGAMVLQGWLSGTFARSYPLSFSASITFEQSYGGVDGDSASLAELVAILSDLSGVPVRQDLAITGSVNQRGEAQAIGGAHYKIEGFFRTCVEAGTLDGSQGVAVPSANEKNLVLSEEIEGAVADGKFSVYSVATIEDAVELFTGVPAGVPDGSGTYPTASLFAKVAAKLEEYDRVLIERNGAI